MPSHAQHKHPDGRWNHGSINLHLRNQLRKLGVPQRHLDDLAQDAWIRMLQADALGKFDPSKGGFNNWLWNYAKRTAYNFYRDRPKRPGIDAVGLLESIDNPEEAQGVMALDLMEEHSTPATNREVGQRIEESFSRLKSYRPVWSKRTHRTGLQWDENLDNSLYQVFVWFYIQNLEPQFVAQQLGVSIGSVRNMRTRVKHLVHQIKREMAA